MAKYNRENAFNVFQALSNVGGNPNFYKKRYEFFFYLEKPSDVAFKVTEYNDKPVLHITKGKHFLPMYYDEFLQFYDIMDELKEKLEECRAIVNPNNDIDSKANYKIVSKRKSVSAKNSNKNFKRRKEVKKSNFQESFSSDDINSDPETIN